MSKAVSQGCLYLVPGEPRRVKHFPVSPKWGRDLGSPIPTQASPLGTSGFHLQATWPQEPMDSPLRSPRCRQGHWKQKRIKVGERLRNGEGLRGLTVSLAPTFQAPLQLGSHVASSDQLGLGRVGQGGGGRGLGLHWPLCLS